MQPEGLALSAPEVFDGLQAGAAAVIVADETLAVVSESDVATPGDSLQVAKLRGASAHDSVRQEFCRLIGARQWEHWFEGKATFRIDRDDLIVGVHSPFLLKWLQKQFTAPLQDAADRVLGMATRVRMELASGTAKPPAGETVRQPAAQRPPISRPAIHPSSGPAGTPLTSTSVPAIVRAEQSTNSQPSREARKFADLADFVVGRGNELAMAAARRVCQTPGELNPLFVFGSVGNGKSHLLEGIYRQIRRTQTGRQVVYLTAEQFTNHFTQALRDHTLPAFRQRFRTVDVLLVDDVDFLDAKRVVQEEFLHTFQQLESLGRQIILSADRHPRLLSKLSDELRTRFLSGMVCRLEPPDLEMRREIVQRKATRLSGEFTSEALDYIAQRFPRNVRELEGAMQCLQTYHCMTGKRLGVTVARQVLSELERDCVKVVRLADIEQTVCDLFGLSAEDLKSPKRTRSLSQPRMLAMYLARKHTRAAYSEIGEFFGGRNHSTVIAAEQKISEWLNSATPIQIASQTWKTSELLAALEQQLLAC
jgi:chromosomal replication initiator protein